MSDKFTLVSGDDWEGLYKNGKLVGEGHRIPIDQFAAEAGLELDEFECDFEWLMERGNLPSLLKKVKRPTHA